MDLFSYLLGKKAGGGGSVIVNDSVPVGAIQGYGGSTAPNGWLLCDGSAVSRTTYDELFDAIGTTYGAGDGSTTFNLPDLQGRTMVGAGESSADGHTAHVLGQSAGEETHQLTVDEMPRHLHSLAYNAQDTQSSSKDALTSISWTSKWREITTTMNASGSNDPHNNMQPYLAVNFIIKAKNAV